MNDNLTELKDAKVGGALVGRRHGECNAEGDCGIKLNVEDTGQAIEAESGEGVVTRATMLSKKKYSFMGNEMTPREIISKLNQDGGGVAFENGGEIAENKAELGMPLLKKDDQGLKEDLEINITPVADSRISRFSRIGNDYEELKSNGRDKEARQLSDDLFRELHYRFKRLLPNEETKHENQIGIWDGGIEPSFNLKFNNETPDIISTAIKVAEEFDQEEIHILFFDAPISEDSDYENVVNRYGFIPVQINYIYFRDSISPELFRDKLNEVGIHSGSLSEDGKIATIYLSDSFKDIKEAEKESADFSKKVKRFEDENKGQIKSIKAGIVGLKKYGIDETGGRTEYESGRNSLRTSGEYKKRETVSFRESEWAKSQFSVKIQEALTQISTISPKIGNEFKVDFSLADTKKLRNVGRHFDLMPVMDNSLNVMKCYNELTKVLIKQFKRLPIRTYPSSNPIIKRENINAAVKILNEISRNRNDKEIQSDLYKDLDSIIEWGKSDIDDAYGSSVSMISDVEGNNKMNFYSTDQGFGEKGIDYKDHPLLKNSGFRTTPKPALYFDGEEFRTVFLAQGSRLWISKPMVYNDILRIVHDFIAHAITGASFGARGEEKAWAAHMASIVNDESFSDYEKIFSIQALTTETRGQNTWVNFVCKKNYDIVNPLFECKRRIEKFNSVKGRTAKGLELLKDVLFAIDKSGGIEFSPQKTALLPEICLCGDYDQTKSQDDWIKEHRHLLFESVESESNKKVQSENKEEEDHVNELVEMTKELIAVKQPYKRGGILKHSIGAVPSFIKNDTILREREPKKATGFFKEQFSNLRHGMEGRFLKDIHDKTQVIRNYPKTIF